MSKSASVAFFLCSSDTAPWPEPLPLDPFAPCLGREWIRRPRSFSPCAPGFPSPSLALCSEKTPRCRNPSRAPPRHCRRSSQPLTNRLGQQVRQDLLYVPAEPWFLGSSSSFYCVSTARASSPIPATTRRPEPRRHRHRPRGELENRPVPFPLSIRLGSVG